MGGPGRARGIDLRLVRYIGEGLNVVCKEVADHADVVLVREDSLIQRDRFVLRENAARYVFAGWVPRSTRMDESGVGQIARVGRWGGVWDLSGLVEDLGGGPLHEPEML